MNLRDKKGSIAIFVLIALLFMASFLIIMFSGNINKSKVVKEQIDIIKEIYGKNIENEAVNDIYNRLTAVPTITINKSQSTTGVMEIIIESNGITENITVEYKIDNQTFNSEEDLYQYINENVTDEEEKEITIKATNDLENTEEITKTVRFIGPQIDTLPSTIITNITSVNDSYVAYDELGKKEETYTIVILNETYSTMTEVVARADEWLLDNTQYEVDADIKVTATGNNNLISESTQTIKFIRGVKVTNETELNTALASTLPSYIQVQNDIACSNTISVDGVTHKLDLNNKNISYTLSSTDSEVTYTFVTLGANTNLTVLDSSSEKQGKIVGKISETSESDGDNREATIIGIKNQGTLNIESGIVAADVSRIITSAKAGVGVHDTGIAIQNTGIINLKGGTVLCNVATQSCSYLAIQISEAIAKGIVNSGTINVTSGNIITNADAYAVQGDGAVWKGKTWAYAYGIENSGTINNSENITFSTTATAHEENSREQEEEALDIK